MMDVSINLIVVIILKYIHTSNHHVVDLKLTKCCMSIKLEKKKEKQKDGGRQRPGTQMKLQRTDSNKGDLEIPKLKWL